MTLQQPAMVHHRLPLSLELFGAAIMGAALLFGVLLVAGHTDLLPWSAASPIETQQTYRVVERGTEDGLLRDVQVSDTAR
jgi:hypothetical protein